MKESEFSFLKKDKYPLTNVDFWLIMVTINPCEGYVYGFDIVINCQLVFELGH